MRSQRIFTVVPMLLLLVMGMMACQPQTVVETRVVEVMATRVVEVEGEAVVVTMVVEVAGEPMMAEATSAPTVRRAMFRATRSPVMIPPVYNPNNG